MLWTVSSSLITCLEFNVALYCLQATLYVTVAHGYLLLFNFPRELYNSAYLNYTKHDDFGQDLQEP